MKRVAILAVIVGGIANAIIFRLAVFPLSAFIPAPTSTVLALGVGEFLGGMIAARIARHDLVLNAALAAWTSIVLISLAVYYAASVNSTPFDAGTIVLLLVAAVGVSALGGRAYVTIARRTSHPTTGAEESLTTVK